MIRFSVIKSPFRSASLLCKSNQTPRTRLSTFQTGKVDLSIFNIANIANIANSNINGMGV